MSQRLGNRIALVSGGASGIGRAVCILFAAEGASVGVFDRDADGARACVDEITTAGHHAILLPGDVAEWAHAATAVATLESLFGGLDVLVNTAGVIGTGTVETTEQDEWERIVRVNLTGTYLMSKAAIPALRRRGGGSIVNVSSGGGVAPVYNNAAYAASKGAIVSLTKSMALDFARDRIRVNCLVPGTTATPMTTAAFALNREGGTEDSRRLFGQPIATRIPLGRMGTPEEQASAILFLASDDSSYATGASLVIDGGRTLL